MTQLYLTMVVVALGRITKNYSEIRTNSRNSAIAKDLNTPLEQAKFQLANRP